MFLNRVKERIRKEEKKKLGDSIPLGESTLALALVIPGLPSCCDTMIGRFFGATR